MNTERKTILVVDDERGSRESLQMVLKHDYYILLADRARGGLEILETLHVDLLMTNFMMPEMTGVELLEIVREKYPDMPVTMHSGYRILEVAVKCIKLGAFDYIAMPFKPDEFQATVRHALAYGALIASADASGASPETAEAVLHKWEHLKVFLLKAVLT